MAKAKKDRDETLVEANLGDIADTLSSIFGKREESKEQRWFLHSGNLALDYIMSGLVEGTGGYPCGIVEVHGDPSTGKSLLFAKALAEGQKKGIPCILADAEGRWDYDFSATHGVNSDKLRANTYYPETIEELAIRSEEILQKVGQVIQVVDSIAILSTLQERGDLVDDGEMKADQGRRAQKIKAALRVLSSDIRKTGSLFLISNHMMSSPGAYIPRTTPGGLGIPFQANVRLNLTKPTQIKVKGKDHPVGVQLHIECDKNSVTPPFGACDLDLYFSTGIDKYSGLLNIMKDIEIVETRGAWTYYGEEKFQLSDFANFIAAHPEVLQDGRWKNPYWLEGQK